MSKFKNLAAAFREGTLTESDLVGVSAGDALKIRQEAGDGVLSVTVAPDALFPSLLKSDEEGEADADGEKKSSKPKRRRASYVLVSDGHIPPFNDQVKASAWDLSEFKYRGSNVLWDHNLEQSLPPIGKGSNLKKNVEMKRGGREFRALTGEAEFASADVYPFADMVGRLVEEGLLTGVSVGFYVDDARPVTEKEVEADPKLRSYSSVITKARLFEFSVTPLGRDPNALRLSASGGQASLLGQIHAWAERGVYDVDSLGLLREHVMRAAGDAERFSIVVPDLEVRRGRPLEFGIIQPDGAPGNATATFGGSMRESFGVDSIDFSGVERPAWPVTLSTQDVARLERIEASLAKVTAHLVELRAALLSEDDDVDDDRSEYDILNDEIDGLGLGLEDESTSPAATGEGADDEDDLADDLGLGLGTDNLPA